jgi:acyl-CoA synthetase (AMP-forming)/AMP-acid ligase II
LRHRSLDDLLRDGSSDATGIRTAADEPAFLISTSGTTAEPKGVLYSDRALCGHLPGFLPSQLGVNYNAAMLEPIARDIAPAIGWNAKRLRETVG